MKKIKILVASVLCCAMGYTGYTAYEKTTMSEAEKFMIANVEALTQTEQPNISNCKGPASVDCIALHPTNPELDKVVKNARWTN